MKARLCTHVKITGHRCGSPALRGQPHCYFPRVARAPSPAKTMVPSTPVTQGPPPSAVQWKNLQRKNVQWNKVPPLRKTLHSSPLANQRN
jgi:hypothetical protein